MKRLLPLIWLYIVPLFFDLSCSNPTSPPASSEKPKAVKLKLLNVSCTEAFINIIANDTILPLSITLNKLATSGDEKPVFNFTLTKTDTIVIDTTLQPGKTYIYQTAEEIKGETENSDTLQVKTLDTTSHNFSWQTFTFGDPDIGSSSLNDAVVISDENIWCVGNIYVKDTSKNGFKTYNAIHWDGSSWELKDIYYYGNCSALEYPPLKTIFVFPDNKIVVTNGGSIGWLNGDSVELDCDVNPLLTGAINKIWGTDSKNFFTAGNDGNIVYYHNGQWKKIISGTDLTIHDIWGITDMTESKILAIASEIFEVKGEKVLSINSIGVTELENNGLSWSMATIWFCNEYKEYSGGGGIYVKRYNENNWKEIRYTQYYTYSIRGNGSNDIITCGGNGYLSHFNGKTWKDYTGNQLELISGNYYSVSIKGNSVAAVGALAEGKAIAVIGRR